MRIPGEQQRLATLWDLRWDDDRLACVVYRTSDGLRLSIESANAVVLSEGFDLQPRALAKARALRDALKRRGWQDG
jgi:hypothetical protein